MRKAKPGYKLVKSLFGKYEEIPDDWELKQIKDLAKINPEQIKEEDFEFDKIEYVDISSIENFQITDFKKIPLISRPSRAQRIIKNGDIIVSTVRPYLKSFSQINKEKENLVCSTGFAVIRAKRSSDISFLFNYFKSHFFEETYNRQMEGMAYPAITGTDVSNSFISIPRNKKEREKIGIILSNIDFLLEIFEKSINETKKLRKSLMQQLFTKGIGHKKFKNVKWFFGKEIKVPYEWSIKKLKDITIRVSVGHVGITSKFYCEKKDGILFLRSQNVRNGKMDLKDAVYITKDFNSKLRKSQLKIGDLLVVRVGANRADSCIVPENMEKCNCANIIFARPDKIISKYLDYFFQTRFCKKLLLNLSVGGAQEVINTTDVRNVRVSIPPSNEQRKIVEIFTNIDSKILKFESKKSQLENLKKGLMQKLLTGQIRV